MSGYVETLPFFSFGDYVASLKAFSGRKLEGAEGLVELYSGLKHPIFNYICNRSAEPAVLKERIEAFRENNIPFCLLNGLCGAQLQSSEVIKRFDNVHQVPLDGLVFDLENPTPSVDSPDIEFVWVGSEKQLHQWIEASAFANGHTVEEGVQFFETWSAPQAELLLVLHRKEPVGCSMMCYGSEEYTGNYWDSVIPSYRQQGIGSALVVKRLEHAKAKGNRYVAAQCMESSTGLYQKLGFKKVCELEFYAVMA